jgi:hypothetical protein
MKLQFVALLIRGRATKSAGKVYFNCNNEAWVTDGTDQGTFKLLQDKVIRQWGLNGREIALVNGRFLLAASFNTQSRQSAQQRFVYSTDGPTETPTSTPTEVPTSAPTEVPTGAPSEVPTSAPT